MKVLAALSGGVDSAVAAAAALEAGHQVTGVHLALRPKTASATDGCNAPEALIDAHEAATALGIGLQVWDLSQRFEELVVRDFLDQYAAGRTPNPCVRCNQFIKFQLLQRRAWDLGFDAVCTGHYARLEVTGGVPKLRRARDFEKDQSYVLAAAGASALTRSWFPLGEFASKTEVRAKAASVGLPMADKPDSVDICFVPDGDTKGFLRARLGERPGVLVDSGGQVVGRHRGAHQFTVGQRRGLHLGEPAPDGEPRYVTAIDTATGRVTVGSAADLLVRRFAVSALEWLVPQQQLAPGPPNGRLGQGSVPPGSQCLVQVRAHGAAVACQVTPHRGDHLVQLDQPIRGLAAGQLAVFYDDDLVIGHGTIELLSH